MDKSDWLLANEDGTPFDPEGKLQLGLDADAMGGVHVYIPKALWRWLLTFTPGGPVQKTPTLLVWWDVDVSSWKGVLHNRTAKCSLFRTADTLEELVVALSDALQQEPAGWKRDRSAL